MLKNWVHKLLISLVKILCLTISFSDLSNIKTSTHLLPTPEVTFSSEGKTVHMCVSCLLSLSSLNACVAVVHNTLETDALEQQLQVYSINRSNELECFLIDKDEFNVAVFGLLHDGLERTPAYKTFIRKYTLEFTTSTGKCPLWDNFAQ